MTPDWKDPFGTPDPTIFRPNPGGGRPAQPRSAAPANFGTLVELPSVPGMGPLAAAARPILGTLPWLRSLPACPDVEGLRHRLVQEIELFRQAAQRAGVPERTIAEADYIVAAALDDVIANTPWGAGAAWPQRSLASQRHKDATGGDRVFMLLENYRRDPNGQITSIELIFLVLSLGFEGRFRITAQGRSELAQIRESLYRLLRQARGERQHGLSVEWRPVAEPARRLGHAVPLWALGAAALTIATAIYAGLSFWLSGTSDDAYELVANLPPHGIVESPAAAPIPAVPVGRLVQIQSFLQPEIAQHAVTVTSVGRNVVIRILGSGMFASGSAEVGDGFIPRIVRISDAVATIPGSVVVTGHTDNQPVRSLKYPSNFELSAARAEAVRQILQRNPGLSARVSAEGRADTEPAATNDTVEGRDQNRRIEVSVPETEYSR